MRGKIRTLVPRTFTQTDDIASEVRQGIHHDEIAEIPTFLYEIHLGPTSGSTGGTNTASLGEFNAATAAEDFGLTTNEYTTVLEAAKHELVRRASLRSLR